MPVDAPQPSVSDRYGSHAWYAAEVERIFRRAWLPAARASELREPGDFLALTLFEEPVLLVRQADGAVRAMSNICRHRFATLAEGSGRASRFVCPYHAWTYANDGALLNAPCMEGAPAFDRTRHNLPTLAVEEWQGWIFVALGSPPAPLAATLAPLAETLSSRDLETWVIARRLTYAAPWNWKLMVENFSESYHHTPVHKQTLQPFWPARDTFGVDTNGHYAELRHPVHPDAGSFTVYSIFPTLFFAVTAPAPVMYWPKLTIRGPRDMELEMIVLAAPTYAADDAAMDAHAASIDLINQEDFPLLLKSQAGAMGRHAALGPLSHLEQPISLFHSYIERMMRD